MIQQFCYFKLEGGFPLKGWGTYYCFVRSSPLGPVTRNDEDVPTILATSPWSEPRCFECGYPCLHAWEVHSPQTQVPRLANVFSCMKRIPLPNAKAVPSIFSMICNQSLPLFNQTAVFEGDLPGGRHRPAPVSSGKMR